MKQWLKKWRLVSVFAVLALALSGCGGEPFLSALKPAGEVAQKQYDLMLLSTGIMVIVIAVVVVIFVVAIIRFRRTKAKENMIPKQVEGNHVLEIIWTVIPIILLLVLAIPVVAATFNLGDTAAMEKKDKDGKPKELVVNVRSNLYWWEFEYPGLGIVTSQDLVVPTDQKVYFSLKSSDVKHSFWIPAVGGKIDTNVDNVNKFWLKFDSQKAKEAGDVFYGKCAELCGPSHALMDFKVKPMSQDDFAQWVKNMKSVGKEGVQPTSDLAKQGEDIFKSKMPNSCIGCHAVSPDNSTPETARRAPNLTDFGERERVAGILDHNKENIKKWIKDPQAYKPGNKMPAFKNLSDQDLDALAEYLMGLKVQQ
ncbi:cytochrome c oxidase subunit II [Heyndrickxia sporothermodurans]|uniref:Cytochrome c oxidase subunit 2 n=1 Tax=Heyndrickxia sporothermodurans TaxID=46224 RepID=A0A150KWC9_9BACI|nr:cytochrome c oxidase subunit II [Heyndrickxia sporothermodurans]KYD04385.1 Cytochrome c oxidase polypeptide II [Heyndrickxia sporothermodurans]MBL5768485.1 cytochrome c oxidase subunit II [Heyndrickxia sporothermodurans]MBL5772152.1 cytochrome c oxidase subunit II [Heyndrickxia sporothermodurans]MBL5775703.1 cytochrome c oxidase subunit II [Heyndrickxia sporothermodurans]MBL5779291.1 cytochrome c oxidase subunit II [Heyndrickxia sporothermodurans]